METIAYSYQNAPIPGGGYVTGFVFHPKRPGILYCRTDIGGTYRFDRKHKRWVSLIDHVTGQNLSQTYPAALALDENDPEVLYIASGIYGEESGLLSISHDRGHSLYVSYDGGLHFRTSYMQPKFNGSRKRLPYNKLAAVRHAQQ